MKLFLSRSNIPASRPAIAAGRHEHLAVGREDDGIRAVGIVMHGPDGLGISRLDIPQLDGFVRTRRSQPSSVAGEGDGVD